MTLDLCVFILFLWRSRENRRGLGTSKGDGTMIIAHLSRTFYFAIDFPKAKQMGGGLKADK